MYVMVNGVNFLKYKIGQKCPVAMRFFCMFTKHLPLIYAVKLVRKQKMCKKKNMKLLDNSFKQ